MKFMCYTIALLMVIFSAHAQKVVESRWGEVDLECESALLSGCSSADEVQVAYCVQSYRSQVFLDRKGYTDESKGVPKEHRGAARCLRKSKGGLWFPGTIIPFLWVKGNPKESCSEQVAISRALAMPPGMGMYVDEVRQDKFTKEYIEYEKTFDIKLSKIFNTPSSALTAWTDLLPKIDRSAVGVNPEDLAWAALLTCHYSAQGVFDSPLTVPHSKNAPVNTGSSGIVK